MSEELKPCPFCGSSDVFLHGIGDAIVTCGECGACGPSCSYSWENTAKGNATEKWNRRNVPGESDSPATSTLEPVATDHTVWITELELRIAKLERYVRSEQALKER